MKPVFRAVALLLLAVLSAPITARAATARSVSLTVAPEFEHPCVGYSSVTLVATLAGAPAALDLLHRAEGGDWTDAGAFSYDAQSGTYTISVSEPSAASYEYAAVITPVSTSGVAPQVVLPWNVPGIALAEDKPSSEVHTELGLSAALSCVKGGDVRFGVTGPGADTAPAPVAATGPDVATSYTSDVAGTDTVTASYKICSDVKPATCNTFRSDAVEHQWTAPTASLALTGPSTSCVGQSVSVSAVVQQDQSALSGVVVNFDLSGSGGSALSFTATSDASGTATISYSRSRQTLDAVIATATIPGASPDPVTAHATLAWSTCTLVASLDPEHARVVAGSRLTETVTVFLNGTPAAGAQVDLAEAMAGQPTVTMHGATPSDGSVAFALTRDVPGIDQLIVTARYAGNAASRATTVLWAPAAPSSTAVPSPQQTAPSSAPTVASPPASVAASVAAIAVPTAPSPTPAAFSRNSSPTRPRAIVGPARASTRSTSPRPAPRRSPPGPVTPRRLTVRDASPLAGARDAVTGSGCLPGASVVVAVDGVAAARTRADVRGRFHARFVAPARPIGRHRLTATCGRVNLETPLDYVTSASSGGATGVLIGALLVGLVVVAFVVVPVLRRGFGISRV